MNRRKRLFFLVPFILLSHLACRSTSGGLYTGAAPETIFRGAVTLMKSNPETRFAVFDFTDGSGSFTAYGKIIGDETHYRLSALKGIQLLERRKLGAILEEHHLEQSGLVSGADRERIGRLLPVDIMVVGSYVFEGERIKVNGRYTEFETGEIKGTFVYYLDSPMAAGKGDDAAEEEPSSCEPYEEMIEPFMRDLRTPAKVEKAVRAAVTIPYTMKCRHIHQDIMSTFTRGGLYPDQYKRFLHDTVIAVRDPAEMERKTSVFYYYQSDKKIDEQEWNTGLLAMKNANERTVRRVVGFILNRGQAQDEALLQRRIDMLMALSGAGAFGKPLTLTQEQMFQAVFSVGPPNETTRGIRLYLLEKYAHALPKDEKNLSHILSYSEKSLVSEKDPRARKKFYHHIRDIFSSADPNDENGVALQLIQFTGEMHYRYGKEDAPELRALSLALAPWFCYSVTQVRSDYRLQAAIGILKKYNIQCGR